MFFSQNKFRFYEIDAMRPVSLAGIGTMFIIEFPKIKNADPDIPHGSVNPQTRGLTSITMGGLKTLWGSAMHHSQGGFPCNLH